MNILKRSTPNFHHPRRCQVKMIVVHVMDGTLAGTDAWFAQSVSEVSAHYGIGLDGTVHQYVDEGDEAWHAGVIDDPTVALEPGANPNWYSIGIEHEGFVAAGRLPRPWSEDQLAASAELIADIAKRYNIPIDTDHVVGHHAIYALHNCPGPDCPLDTLITMAKERAAACAS